MSDFDAIEPPCESVEFAGELRKITPLKVGQLPAFARAIKPVSGSIEAIASGSAQFDLHSILELIADHGEHVIEAVAIASGLPKKQIEDATADELIKLAMVALRVNADFFKGRLTPALLAAIKGKDQMAGDGLTP